MSNILKWSLKKAIIAFTALFSATVVVSAFLAPVLAGSNFNIVSDFLYNFLHKLCCKYETNSFFIMSNPVGLCARCVGAYISGAITLYSSMHKFKMRKIVFIILGVLIAVEIGCEYAGLFVANDFIRLLSGLFIGAFLGTSLVKILDWLEGKKGW